MNKQRESPDELVLLRTFSTDWEAYIAKGVLENEGIPSIVNNEIMSGIYPIGFNKLGGVRLLVFRRDLEKAAEAIKNCEA
ncbi:MAG: DUF2007 domain-containing protein [Paramuribaculum sp.]|nr:DUF2007 domain-containing protein [Paramuribaculum sp.]